MNQNLLERVAANLRTLRGQRGVSREVLGAAAEVDPQMIKRIESGRANPALTVLSRLTAALAVSLSLVVSGDLAAATTSSEPTTEIIESETVGETIRSLRMRRGISARTLARRAELQALTIRRYERGSVDARLLELEPIVAVLGMETEEFVRAVEQRQRQSAVLGSGWNAPAPGVSVRLLASGERSRVWELRLAPSSSWTEEAPLGAVEEIATAVRGDLRVEVGEDVHALRRGDSLVLPLEVARKFTNAGRATARVFRYEVTK